jgi:enamine deaminase RidA (YjgF/YER057c/UK114 family)
MFTRHNPPDLLPPGVIAPLSWGVEVPAGHRLLVISGQVGVSPDGRVPDGLIEQAKLTWANIGGVLRSANLDSSAIIRTGIYLSSTVAFTEEERAAFNRERVAFLGDNRPASTLIFVHRLMDPRWLVEIDALAAAPVA